MIQYIIVTPEGQVRDPGTINILKQAIVEDIVNNPEKSWAFIRFMLDQCVLCKAKPAPMAEMNLSDSTELTQLTSSQPDRLQDNDAYVL